jgi:uncharacterized membrane protein YraQ (UPF0718 family)
MTGLIEVFFKIKNKIYEYGIVIVAFIVIVAGTYGYYINKKLQNLNANYQLLEKDRNLKDVQIKAQESIIADIKKNALDKEKLVIVKDAQIAVLNKQVDNLQKTQHIEMAKNAEQVKEKIYAMYNDKQVEFTPENKFLLTAPTTYNLVYDAENWHVNGPILTENNNILLKSNFALREGMGLKDSLIQDLKNIQNNQDVLIVSLKDKDKISDQEIKNLQKTLVIENKKTVYKIVGSFIAGAITYYVLDRSRNH